MTVLLSFEEKTDDARACAQSGHCPFNNSRDTLGFRTLAQQAFVRHVPCVWESFQDATSQPYGFLVLDLHP